MTLSWSPPLVTVNSASEKPTRNTMKQTNENDERLEARRGTPTARVPGDHRAQGPRSGARHRSRTASSSSRRTRGVPRTIRGRERPEADRGRERGLGRAGSQRRNWLRTRSSVRIDGRGTMSRPSSTRTSSFPPHWRSRAAIGTTRVSLVEEALLGERRFESITSERCYTSYGDVLTRPHHRLATRAGDRFVKLFIGGLDLREHLQRSDGGRDPKDDKIVETALTRTPMHRQRRPRPLRPARVCTASRRRGRASGGRPIRVVARARRS